jgi:hypothetical protein
MSLGVYSRGCEQCAGSVYSSDPHLQQPAPARSPPAASEGGILVNDDGFSDLSLDTVLREIVCAAFFVLEAGFRNFLIC